MCSGLLATNIELKKNLETVRSALPDPIVSYTQEINDKLTTVTAIKQSLTEAHVDVYTLIDQEHDWSGNLAQKNQLVYPLRE